MSASELSFKSDAPADKNPPSQGADEQRSLRRIAHDFNNTLGIIVGNLELVRMDLEPAHPASESVMEIRKATDRARELVKELFAVAGAPLAVPLAPEVPEAEVPSPVELPRGDGQHILFLDDEEPLVFLASNLFKRLGYRVSGFTDPQTACDAFFRNPGAYHLVVTDHNLRSVSGIDVARRMIETHPHLRVILATGELTEALSEQAKDVGIRHVLYKPNTVEGLCQAIHRLATAS